MRKFRASELEKRRKGKLDCAPRPGQREAEKKEQDVSGFDESGREQ